MEIFPLLAFVFAILIPLALRFFANSRKRLPPGSLGWPIIGETLQFQASFVKGKAHEFVRERTSKYNSQVIKTSLFGDNVAILSGPSGNKFLFTNEKKLITGWRPRSMRKLFPSQAFFPIEDDPKKHRSYIGLFFKPDKVEELVNNVESVTKHHLKNYWLNKNEVKAFELLKLYTFTLVCRTFLSIEDSYQISKLLHQFTFFTQGLLSIDLYIPGTAFYNAKNASKALQKEIGSIIRKRRVALLENPAEAPKDVLTQMLNVPTEDGTYMTEFEMIDMIVAFLLGGHETTAATITSTMKFLAEKPQLAAEVLKEQAEIAQMMKTDHLSWDDLQKMKKTWNFVSEVMRVIPTAQGTFREAKTDFTFDGFLIPKGWKIYLIMGNTQQDPNFFPDPEKFDPSRFEGNGPQPYTYTPFWWRRSKVPWERVCKKLNSHFPSPYAQEF